MGGDCAVSLILQFALNVFDFLNAERKAQNEK